MESKATAKKKWYNWRLLAILIVAIAVFVKFFVLEEKEKNQQPLVVELDLNNVALRSEQEVEAVLGKGKLDSYYKDENAGCDRCPKYIYKDGAVEIIFINEIADRIALRKLSDFDFDDRVILGLLNFRDVIEPTFEDDAVKRWENYKKYSQIAAFSKGGKIDYILIKSKEN